MTEPLADQHTAVEISQEKTGQDLDNDLIGEVKEGEDDLVT